MIIERLKLEGMTPDQIDDAAPLFGDGLGLDSIDALELVLGIEQTFGVKIEDEASGLQAFKSVDALTAFIAEHQPA
jgi:acyl carrier protein